MSKHDEAIATTESASNYDDRADAIVAALGLLDTSADYWATPFGQALKPLWLDFDAEMEYRAKAEAAARERRILANDYEADDPFVNDGYEWLDAA